MWTIPICRLSSPPVWKAMSAPSRWVAWDYSAWPCSAGASTPTRAATVPAWPARCAASKRWGVKLLLQTNAAGSLRPTMPPGSLMLITDHINATQRSPLVGETGNTRFVDMSAAYDPELLAHTRQLAKAKHVALGEGTYLWALGPQFETPAEIRMFAAWGADAVGMSTVPETILARHAGLRVLGLSLMTNMAAGLSSEALSHAATLQQAQESGAHAARFLTDLIASLADVASLHR
jgi:purine-nucleoside phosphorylase